MRSSGKLLILAMVGIGLAAAGASWWFRYSATHRAAEFWGPEAARLIRDADKIVLCRVRANDEDADSAADTLLLPDGIARRTVVCRNVSAAPGVTHLRNALLEDHSFDWPATSELPPAGWRWCLAFHDTSAREDVYVWFSPDLDFATHSLSAAESPRVASCERIAVGLAEIFAEQFSTDDLPPAPPHEETPTIR
jgi:hypothetical protein